MILWMLNFIIGLAQGLALPCVKGMKPDKEGPAGVNRESEISLLNSIEL